MDGRPRRPRGAPHLDGAGLRLWRAARRAVVRVPSSLNGMTTVDGRRCSPGPTRATGVMWGAELDAGYRPQTGFQAAVGAGYTWAEADTPQEDGRRARAPRQGAAGLRARERRVALDGRVGGAPRHRDAPQTRLAASDREDVRLCPQGQPRARRSTATSPSPCAASAHRLITAAAAVENLLDTACQLSLRWGTPRPESAPISWCGGERVAARSVAHAADCLRPGCRFSTLGFNQGHETPPPPAFARRDRMRPTQPDVSGLEAEVRRLRTEQERQAAQIDQIRNRLMLTEDTARAARTAVEGAHGRTISLGTDAPPAEPIRVDSTTRGSTPEEPADNGSRTTIRAARGDARPTPRVSPCSRRASGSPWFPSRRCRCQPGEPPRPGPLPPRRRRPRWRRRAGAARARPRTCRWCQFTWGRGCSTRARCPRTRRPSRWRAAGAARTR